MRHSHSRTRGAGGRISQCLPGRRVAVRRAADVARRRLLNRAALQQERTHPGLHCPRWLQLLGPPKHEADGGKSRRQLKRLRALKARAAVLASVFGTAPLFCRTITMGGSAGQSPKLVRLDQLDQLAEDVLCITLQPDAEQQRTPCRLPCARGGAGGRACLSSTAHVS
eukprot:SAG11_NODE_1625_length_4552_cov_3.448586_3_plen_168_part_00